MKERGAQSVESASAYLHSCGGTALLVRPFQVENRRTDTNILSAAVEREGVRKSSLAAGGGD